MSATNRGAEADTLGRYDTPAWATQLILDVLGEDLPGGRWLEPCAGCGSIIEAVEDHDTGKRIHDWDAFDIEPRGDMGAEGLIVAADWLELYDNDPTSYDCCPTNPPFPLAYEFAHRLVYSCDVVMLLLRLNWYEGAPKKQPERGDWLDENNPDIFVFQNRPIFTRDGKRLVNEKGQVKAGTDATAYAWFVWGLGGGRHWRLPAIDADVRSIRKIK